MRFIKIFCFIISIQIALGSEVKANISAIVADTIVSKQYPVKDKKQKAQERKKVVIEISKDFGYVLLTILDIIIGSYEYSSGCSSRHHY